MKARRSSLMALVFATLFFLAAGGVFAGGTKSGGATIHGKVLDGNSGRGLAGATVFVVEAGLNARTDGGGKYTISGISAGNFTVQCSKPGYVSQAQQVMLTPSSRMNVNFTLWAAGQPEKPKAEDKKAEPMPAEEAEAPAPARDRVRGRRMVKEKKVMTTGAMMQPAAPPMGGAGGEGWVDHNTESYDRIYENEFLAVTQNPLSTFSIDVDTASYANTRRFITQMNRLPPKDAVRVEEFINYFDYDYPQPRGKHPFAVVTEVSRCPWNENHRLVHIGLQGKKLNMEELPATNLVFLLDVSGSMNSPNKLPLLKAAFKMLVNNMRSTDRVAIVVYAGAAGLVLPSTPGSDRDRILGALDALQAGGSTAGGAGIKLAYKVALENFIKGGNNRVILATDGDFNVGASSDAEMTRLIEEKREKGVFLTVLGFGMGNYKDSKMEKLADKGNGNYGYIDSILEAKKVLVTEMGGTLFTIAKDVKLQIEFNPTRVKAYRLVGYENRMLKAEDFNDDKKDAGELGAGHTVTALYEIIPAGSEEPVKGVDELKYQKTKVTGDADSDELLTVKLRYKKPDGKRSTLIEQPLVDKEVALNKTSNNFRWSAAVAQFGLLLRDSQHKGDATFTSVRELAKNAKGEDKEGYRYEFIKLVDQAELLSKNK